MPEELRAKHALRLVYEKSNTTHMLSTLRLHRNQVFVRRHYATDHLVLKGYIRYMWLMEPTACCTHPKGLRTGEDRIELALSSLMEHFEVDPKWGTPAYS